jgi:hypothetical protein
MPFTWTTLPVTAGSSQIVSPIVAEIRTNINTDRGYVGLAAIGAAPGTFPTNWTKTIAAGVKIEEAEYTEMKTALDAAWDANICTAHRVTHYSIYQSTHDASYRATHQTTYLSGDDGTVESSHLHTNRATHYATYQGSHHTSDKDTNNTSHDVDYHASHWTTHYGTNLAKHNASYDVVYNSGGVNNFYYVSDETGYDNGVNSGDNNTYEGAYNPII